MKNLRIIISSLKYKKTSSTKVDLSSSLKILLASKLIFASISKNNK